MKIIKDSLIYSLGEIFSRAIPFLLLPYLTRSLGVDGYGSLAYYQVIILLLIIFIGLSQETAVSKFYFRYGKRSILNLVFAGIAINLAISSAVIAVALFFNATVIALIALCASSQVVLSVQMTLKQCQKKSRDYVAVQFLNGLFSVLITVFIFEFFIKSAEGRVFSIFIANVLAAAVAFLLYNKGRLLFKVRPLRDIKKYILFLLVFGFPLIFHKLSLFAKGQLDRVFIESLYDKSSLGVYSAGGQIALILFVVMIAVNKATLPYYFEALKKNKIDKRWIIKLSVIFLIVSPFPAIFFYLVPSSVYIYVLGEGFSNVGTIAALITMGYALYLPYYPLVNFFFYEGKTAIISKTTIVSGVFHISLVAIFSKYSIELVASAMFFSNLVLYFILLFYFIKHQNGK